MAEGGCLLSFTIFFTIACAGNKSVFYGEIIVVDNVNLPLVEQKIILSGTTARVTFSTVGKFNIFYHASRFNIQN